MKLDGREFIGADQKITAAQNDYIQGHLSLAGVTDLLVRAGTNPSEEQLGEIRKNFLIEILLSGQKSFILAGCLTEVGKKWSRAEADRNAARFDEITEPDEVMEMTNGIAGVVISFFRYAVTFSETSRKSSNPSDAVPATTNAEPEISVSSPQSFAKWPVTIPADSTK